MNLKWTGLLHKIEQKKTNKKKKQQQQQRKSIQLNMKLKQKMTPKNFRIKTSNKDASE